MEKPSPVGTPILGDHVWLKLPITPEMNFALSALSRDTKVSKRSLTRTALVTLLRDSGFPSLADLPATTTSQKKEP